MGTKNRPFESERAEACHGPAPASPESETSTPLSGCPPQPSARLPMKLPLASEARLNSGGGEKGCSKTSTSVKLGPPVMLARRSLEDDLGSKRHSTTLGNFSSARPRWRTVTQA